MRDTFIKTLTNLSEKNKDVFLLTADLGFKIFDDFRIKFPDRFINLGVAESNMIGVGAGLAMSDKKVYCYSIAPFLTMRPFEQIRLDVCYHNLDVKLIGSGGGLAYALEGITHHAIEDIAIMRALPNMTVVCPGDLKEVEAITKLSLKHVGPMYIRLPKTSPSVHQEIPKLKIGEGFVITKGADITLLTTGNMLYCGKKVADSLLKKGLSTQLISMHTVKPVDSKIVLKSAEKTGNVFVLEEHSRIGGLGSAVAEVLAESGFNGIFKSFSLPDAYCEEVGGHECLREIHKLSPNKIIKELLRIHNN
jgi:transketolase